MPASLEPARARLAPYQLTAWYSLGLLAILTLPSLKFPVPFWSLEPRELVAFALLVAGYAISAAITGFRQARSRLPLQRILGPTLIVWCFVLLGILMLGGDSSRFLILAVACATVFLTVAPEVLGRFPGTAMTALVLGTAGSAALGMANSVAPTATTAETVSERAVATAFTAVRLAEHDGYVPQPAVRGGGFSRLGRDMLLGTGDGALYHIDRRAADRDIDVRPLPYEVPHNGAEFAEDNGTEHRERRVGEQDLAAGQPEAWRFRVMDVLAQQLDGQVRLFATHHYWYGDRRCFVMRLSMLQAGADAFLDGTADADWETVYETEPCLPLSGEDAKRSPNPFDGHESGGRMALLDDQTLLLTVGDHAFAGVDTNLMLAQDRAASYGKTLMLDLDDGSAELFTLGHRNPQGLLVDAEGAIWSTEQGPEGGDELNLLRQGRNYGWPHVTLGTNYGSTAWPLNESQGEHEGYEPPVFAWLPSVATTNLIEIRGDKFPIWAGDLLVASLAGQSLFRLRVRDQRVVFVEPISIGQRIRDVIQDTDGTILLWTDNASIITLEPASDENGDALFASRCSGCHKVADGTLHGIGPDLGGFLERDIASAPGYEYSGALEQRDGRWTEEALAEYMADPQSFAPGTTMASEPITDPESRAAIVEHLEELSGGGNN